MPNSIPFSLTLSSSKLAALVNAPHHRIVSAVETLAPLGIIELPTLRMVVDTSSAEANAKMVSYEFSGAQGKRASLVITAHGYPECVPQVLAYWQDSAAAVTVPTFALERAALELATVAITAAKAFGSEGDQAYMSADCAIRKLTGVSPLALLGRYPVLARKEIDRLLGVAPDKLLTPMELGKSLGLTTSATQKLLMRYGFQVVIHNAAGKLEYALTEPGKEFGVYQDTEKTHPDGTPVRQLQWKHAILYVLPQSEL